MACGSGRAKGIGEGSNNIISQIHHYFEMNPAENLVSFSDNCVAQNKNAYKFVYFTIWHGK